MRSKSGPQSSAEAHVREIRRATRKKHSAEERISIVLTGLRGSAKFYPTGAKVACAAKLSLDRESGYGHPRRRPEYRQAPYSESRRRVAVLRATRSLTRSWSAMRRTGVVA